MNENSKVILPTSLQPVWQHVQSALVEKKGDGEILKMNSDGVIYEMMDLA